MGMEAIVSNQPILILHLGQHKTGSKALQSFLTDQSDWLASEHGILYPKNGRNPTSVHRAYQISHHLFYSLLRNLTPLDSLLQLFARIDAERLDKGCRNVLISAEDLFDMHTAHELDFDSTIISSAAKTIAQVARTFHYRVELVLYLRRQDHLLVAHYAQLIKGSSVIDLSFESFAHAFSPRLRSFSLLAQWADVFGDDHICLRRYEPAALPYGIVPDFLSHILGLDLASDQIRAETNPESTNITPTRDIIEFLRLQARFRRLHLPSIDNAAVLRLATERARGHTLQWLSPSQQRLLLLDHAEDNAKIARRWLHQADGVLFEEPLPDPQQTWQPYPGLGPEAARALSLAIWRTKHFSGSLLCRVKAFLCWLLLYLR
jgi:hypothetical protein